MKSLNAFKGFKKFKEEKGNALIISYLALVVFLGLGAAFMKLISNEARVSERQRLTTVAFHIAEAGIERALYDLRQDFVNSEAPSWDDNDINGMAVESDTLNFYTIPYDSTALNGGSYTAQLKNVSGGRAIWVQSTGTINDITQTLQIFVRMIDVSPWNNAIFAGSGASGTMVNGNVDVRGSVHILGSGLNPGDYAIDLGGTAEFVGNNYSGLNSTLEGMVPALATTVVGGETVETLNAELRVKKGMVGLSGSSTVGEANQAGDSEKEWVDGVYVTDGFGGNQGALSAFSDNGTTNGYDLGDAVSFPSLSDPSPEDADVTVQQHFQDNALVLTTQLSAINPTSSFTYSDGTNSISMDGGGNLTIQGRVYIDGNNSVNFAKQGSAKTITYSGNGTLLVTGNIGLHVNLVTSGANSFPNNIMGFMTPNDISMNEAGIDVMGVFYAENQVSVARQTDVMGTIVSNYFNMGVNVPAIYQVPATAYNLPPGMIGNESSWFMVVAWLKV